jgi:tetratricopeptide (TPR) repeat protein
MDQAFFRAQAGKMAQKQVHYLLEAPERLSVETSLSQAVGLIRDCVRHLGLPDLAIRLALEFHPAVERWAAWAFWVTALDLVVPLAREEGRPDARILLCRSQAARELGDYAMARELAVEARDLAEARQEKALLAMALNKIGMIAWRRHQLPEAREALEEAYRHGRDLLEPVELGHIQLNLGIVAVHQDRLAEARSLFNQALAHYKAASDSLHVAKVQCNLADLLRRQGDLRQAVSTIEPALKILRDMGAVYSYGLAENDRGYILLSLQDYDRAREAFETALETLRQVGAVRRQAWVLSNIVELYVTMGEWGQAEATIREARTIATLADLRWILANIDVDEGRMLAARGYPDQARAVWERALAIQIAENYLVGARQTRDLLATLPPHT